MKPSFVWILQCCWVQIFTCDNDLATDFSFSRNDIATSKERQRETDTDTDRDDGYSCFLPSSRYKNLNPKLKPNTAGIACFSKTLFINYCRSSKSLSKCNCWSSIYTNWTIPKLPFQILTTASALLQLSIIYMSTTSLKPFSLSSFFYAFLQTRYLLL